MTNDPTIPQAKDGPRATDRRALGKAGDGATAPGFRYCASCTADKPLAEFYRRGRNTESLDSWCNDCHAKSAARWRENNRGRLKNKNHIERRRVRAIVIAHYGPACACCGETEDAFLAIDHIKKDGAAHRRGLGHAGKGASFYKWLLSHGLPDGFRVLCHNCNSALGYYGFCPHQRDRSRFRCEAVAA